MPSIQIDRVKRAQSFALMLEELGLGMHCGILAVFGHSAPEDEAPLEIAHLQDIIERIVPEVPRARQRVRRIPIEAQWVWTDDERFNLHYHVRHSRLPAPGDERQLKRLVGRLMSERLDRNRPLWELWVIEGVASAHFALLLKFHSDVLEGAAISELLDSIGRLDAAASLQRVPKWTPRPAPATPELLADAAAHWSAKTFELLERARQRMSHPWEALRTTPDPTAWGELLREVLGATPPSVLNPRTVGGHRRVDLLQLPTQDCDRVAHGLSAPTTDIALAVLAGGLESFLHDRGDKPDASVLETLISIPPELGGLPDAPTVRVALPLNAADPMARVVEVGRARLAAETGPQLSAHDLLDRLESWIPPSVQRVVHASRGRRDHHLNVELLAAPQRVPKLLGAEARDVTLFAPLGMDQGLSVGIVRGSQQLSFGFNSDWDLFPDLHELVTATERCFVQLCARMTAAQRSSETPRERRQA